MKTESMLSLGLVSSNRAEKFTRTVLSKVTASAFAAHSLGPLKFIPVGSFCEGLKNIIFFNTCKAIARENLFVGPLMGRRSRD